MRESKRFVVMMMFYNFEPSSDGHLQHFFQQGGVEKEPWFASQGNNVWQKLGAHDATFVS